MGEMTAGTHRPKVEKLRLNDAQWKRLQSLAGVKEAAAPIETEIGRASCRERVL